MSILKTSADWRRRLDVDRSCPACSGERGPVERRARRVLVLLAAVIVLSVADLVVTIGHLQTVGLIEANPIAAWLIRTTESPWVLSAYKCLTVGVCIALLYRLRRYRECEIAAWCAVGILVAMSLLWHSYSMEMESPLELKMAQAAHEDIWLRLD
ncbi:MAG: hypothetical protein GY715_17935 [Planctomycetes bacterium]|nr:hypothetical protein [Planctomycetota bacterium]